MRLSFSSFLSLFFERLIAERTEKKRRKTIVIEKIEWARINTFTTTKKKKGKREYERKSAERDREY